MANPAQRFYKTFKLKSSKITASVNMTTSPWELDVSCLTHIKATKKAKIYFDGNIEAFTKWAMETFFNNEKFCGNVSKSLPSGFKMDWLHGVKFESDFSISKIKKFENNSLTPFNIILKFTVPNDLAVLAHGKPSKLNNYVYAIYEAIDKTLGDVNENSEGLLFVYFKTYNE